MTALVYFMMSVLCFYGVCHEIVYRYDNKQFVGGGTLLGMFLFSMAVAGTIAFCILGVYALWVGAQ